MVRLLVGLVLVGYLPGALAFRWPSAGRPTRAALPAEERVFWAVMLSLTTSCMLALGLGALGLYTFSRLLWGLGAICAALIVGSGFNLRLGSQAARPGCTALLPLAFIALGVWLFFPSAEWVLGGRDPGVYTNQGVRLAQRGSLNPADELVASLPPDVVDLVLSPAQEGYRGRFMGFLVEDTKTGTVIGQFPHFYPASLAIGYGLDGLSGVRRAAGVWGILGLLAVYFAGSLYFGRPAAAAAAGLLGVHIAQVWFARTPNTELPMQALLFTALLAYARMESTGSRYFGVAAASFIGAMLFLRVDTMIVILTIAGAVLLEFAVGRKVRWYFVVVLGLWSGLGFAYLASFVRPYLQMPIGFIENFTPLHWMFTVLGLSGLALLLTWLRRRCISPPGWLPAAVVLAALAGAGYAYVLRQPGGLLAPHDAYALRSFTVNYFTPYLLAAALAGFAMWVPRVFWAHPWMPLLVSVFCAFFFYKIRIVAEHFWVARRFLPVILPSMLLFAGAAAFHSPWRATQGWRGWLARGLQVAGAVVLTAAGWHFVQQTRPILSHVEYAGVIPRLEALAARIHDDDLVIIESRGASDLHALGLPLAYIYARNVVVLATDLPKAADVTRFVDWATRRFSRVVYMGGGGSRLLSRTLDAQVLGDEVIQVPEYERSWDHFPAGSRPKSFVFTLFRLVPFSRLPAVARVDVGVADELAVTGFHTRERNSDLRFRWTAKRSSIRLRLPADRVSTVTIWMGNGGRPAGAAPAKVAVFAGDRLIGSVLVTDSNIRPFEFPLPREAVDEGAGSEGFLLIRLETPTWNPRDTIGTIDDRNLGVMVTRVELR
jgi:hypothetical protein